MNHASYPVSTFWNEEEGRSELRFAGVVLYGDNQDTRTVMGKIVEWVGYVERVKRAYDEVERATEKLERATEKLAHVCYETEPYEPRDTKEKEGTP